MPKYVALFYGSGDGDPSRSEEFEAASQEDAVEAAGRMKTTEARVEVHPLPDGLTDNRAAADSRLD